MNKRQGFFVGDRANADNHMQLAAKFLSETLAYANTRADTPQGARHVHERLDLVRTQVRLAMKYLEQRAGDELQ